MKAIVAVDKNWGIGFKGNLLERVPEDMKFFKEKTLGKVVVMGRETFESLPGRKPLKDRINIVLSRSIIPETTTEGIIVCSSMDRLFSELAKYPEEDIHIIGGSSVYSQMLPFCSEVYITKFSNTHEADSFYPNLDNDPEWKAYAINEKLTWNDFKYDRYRYVRNILE